MDVSVIIVNYNTRDLVYDCLNSVFRFTSGIKFEVILIDNASVDGSQQMIHKNFQQVILIENNLNSGFGTANNLGAKMARGKYLFLLNSDCRLIDNAIKSFYDYMETNNFYGSIGALGAILCDINLKINRSYHRFPNMSRLIYWEGRAILNRLFPVSTQYRVNYFLPASDNEVDYLSGAALFVPKKVFDQLHGFDEQFFLYFEDADLQKRMSAQEFKRVILKEQKIVHLEGRSCRAVSPLGRSTLFRDSMFKYFRKNSSFPGYLAFYLTITPLLMLPLLSKKHPWKEKKSYLKMLLRWPCVKG